ERPTHRGLAFDTCASSGCHNFHDNRALYEDFLVKHAAEPDVLEARRLLRRDFAKVVEALSDYPIDRYPLKPLAATDADQGENLRQDLAIKNDWLASAHARSGVNCSG
ncbi:NrfA- nitrite reduction protein, partial [Pelomicrobium sp. G1]